MISEIARGVCLFSVVTDAAPIQPQPWAESEGECWDTAHINRVARRWVSEMFGSRKSYPTFMVAEHPHRVQSPV